MKLISIIALLALSGNLHAQTAPKFTAPDGGDTMLPEVLKPEEKDAKKKKEQASQPEPDHEVEASGKTSPSSEAAPEMQKTADEGIQIQVEKSTAKAGLPSSSGAVKIYSPWPAKPITPAPVGWKFAPAPAGMAPYRTTVKLGSGNAVDLSITPFVLVPVSDGLNAIRIAEPGYDPSKKFAQQDTVATMLQNSTAELENNEQQAATAIRRLQLLLSSLPKQQP